MELNDNDKQRIEQAAKQAWKNTITAFEDSDEISFWEGYLTGAEYATLYERQQQQEATGQFLQALVERDRTIEEWKQSYFHELSKKYPEQIEKLEAERSNIKSLLRRYIELQRSAESFSHEGALDKQRVWEELKKFAGV